MEYLIVLLLMPVTLSIPAAKSRIPLMNNMRAPLVAELDMTSLNKEMKEYIDVKVEDQVNKTCHAKIEIAVNDSLIDLKSDMLENFEGEYNGLQQKLTVQFITREESSKKENKELKQNLTTEINQLQQRSKVQFKNLEDSLRRENIELQHNLTTEINQLQQSTEVQFKSLKDSLRKEDKEIKHNLTTEINQLNLELRKETEQLKELKHNLTIEINQLYLELRKDTEQLKSDLEEINIIVRSKLVDCSDLIGKTNKSGVHLIHPGESVGFRTYCDMETDGGGWTVFQRRFNGQTDFYRDWNDYKEGFGDPWAEFWMGNKKLALMTLQRRYELRINLENYQGETAYAKYSTFAIGDESTKYNLTVAGYSGTAGNSLDYQNNQAFSTKDRDNDQWSGNCAEDRKGGWWYNSCHYSNLNGLYGNLSSTTGMRWYYWKHNDQTMKTSSMMMRTKRT